jgi:3-isopropylmalate/(R)-2-methylmalate dehydratase small subunit
MEPVKKVEGRVQVLDRADVDTDQIIPKQFLKRIERSGFGEFLFYDWRRGGLELEPGPPILVTGRNFGCGSSREHAAWALQDYGFEVVIAPSFGDIFSSNCGQIGLVVVALPAEQVRELMGESELTVDLEAQTISDPSGRTIPFDFDPFLRHRLLNGLDDIALTLEHEPAISAFEAGRPAQVDTTALPA